MGYFNPIYIYGVDRFLDDAKESGVDGLIMVDLPPEEERELCLPAIKAGINFIYLTAPTTTAQRLPRILENASGFIYYVSIAGITGTNTASLDDINVKIKNIKAKTTLPIAVGFGIRSPEQAKNIAKIADAAVVGSALVNILKENLDTNNKPLPSLIKNVLSFVRLLAQQIRATTS
jgi:tryptophan synthase alpha chain